MVKPKKRRWRFHTAKKSHLYWMKLCQFNKIVWPLNFWKLFISLLIFLQEFIPPLFVGVLANPMNSYNHDRYNSNLKNYSNNLSLSSHHKLTNNDSSWSKNITNNGGSWSKNMTNNGHNWSRNVTFEKLSRRTFESLSGSDYQDEPLDPPEWSQLSKQDRRILRKQMRKQKNKIGHGQGHSLPGGRQALAIATKEAIKPGLCRIMQMKQRVRMDGCLPKTIVNNFCYGQCNSFFIPKLSRKRLRTAFESCSVCQPTAFEAIQVTLNCPDRNPPFIEQQILTIKECSCKSVCSITNDVL